MLHEIEGWLEEKQSAFLYNTVAQAEKNPSHKSLFQDLSAMAEKQAVLWAEVASKHAIKLPENFTPNLRARIVARLIRRFGPRHLRLILAAMKVRGISVYTHSHDIPIEHAMPSTLSDVGGRHKGAGSVSNLRAGIFGINDGLVSNASLILGVAAASGDPKLILLAGVTGGLAGAFSMAAGEYVSVRSQREMFEYQIGLEKEELKQYPKEEAAELALIYRSRGIPADKAHELATHLISDPTRALDTLAREELGLNPDDLTSPWSAAFFSFVSFAIGAAVPLLPYLFGNHTLNLRITMGLTGIALFIVGAVMSLFTGRNALWSGIRMVLIGGGAGVATYLIGNLF